MNIKQRLKSLEKIKSSTLGELPMIVSDDFKDEEIKQLESTGRKVYRESDIALIEEFI